MASLISNSHKNAGMKQNTKVGGGGGALPQKRQGCWLYLLGVKKWFWYLLGFSTSKGPQQQHL